MFELGAAVVAGFLIYRFYKVRTTDEDAAKVVPYCKKFLKVT
jgi:hypothetical protein